MHRMLIVFIVCYLLLLDNVENSRLTKSQVVLSRLRQRSPSPSPPSTSIKRQVHTCLSNCFFILYFNESLTLPNDCNQAVTKSACDMGVIIDYATERIFFTAFQNPGGLIFDNTTYDSSASHYAYFASIADDPYIHIFDYVCATGDRCEWEYMQQILPELLRLNYQPMHQLLLPQMQNPNGHPSFTECYNNIEFVNCSSGSCAYFQSMTNTNQLEPERGCSPFDTGSVAIGATRYSPGPSIHDNGYIDIVCDSNRCNDESNINEIKRIISQNANGYIYLSHSSGVKLQWTMNFIFILITYFQF